MKFLHLCAAIALIDNQEALQAQGKIQIIRSIIKAAKTLDRFSKGERAIQPFVHGASHNPGLPGIIGGSNQLFGSMPAFSFASMSTGGKFSDKDDCDVKDVFSNSKFDYQSG